MVAFMTVQEEGGLSLENATKDDPILIGSILGEKWLDEQGQTVNRSEVIENKETDK